MNLWVQEWRLFSRQRLAMIALALLALLGPRLWGLVSRRLGRVPQG